MFLKRSLKVYSDWSYNNIHFNKVYLSSYVAVCFHCECSFWVV